MPVDQRGLGGAELEALVADFGCAVLGAADPVGQQADLDVVADHVVIGDGVRAGVSKVPASRSSQLLVVAGREVPGVKLLAL